MSQVVDATQYAVLQCFCACVRRYNHPVQHGFPGASQVFDSFVQQKKRLHSFTVSSEELQQPVLDFLSKSVHYSFIDLSIICKKALQTFARVSVASQEIYETSAISIRGACG